MTKSDETIRCAIDQPNFGVVRNQLLDFRSRTSSKLPANFWSRLAGIKEDFVKQDKQLGAKASWCLEIVGHIQDNFISALLHIKSEDYQEAWNLLEQCEKAIKSLDRHYVESQDEFGIEHVRVHTQQLQELYHLKWGFSLGYLSEEVYCSVCQTKRRLRGDCGHEIGEIYDGEICHNVVRKGRILHISLVDNPAQKYSVIWPDDDTQFIVLKCLVDELLSPWDVWDYRKEIRRRYHPVFRNAGHDDLCPCNSNLKYKNCCLKKETIPDFPHYQFMFAASARGQFPNLKVIRVNS